jgi:ribose/xylose/arabinose/galactoside ABC-type transport system permease subunit
MKARLGAIAPRLITTPVTPVIVLFVAVAVFGVALDSGVFLTQQNLDAAGVAVAVPLLIAIGAAIGLLGGIVDLSIGSVVGLSGAIFAELWSKGLTPVEAGSVAVAAGLAVGAFNALICVRFGADPLIATLGSLTAVRGLVLVILGTQSKQAFLTGLYSFTNNNWLGIPKLFLIVCVLAAIAVAALTLTRPGRQLRATGGDPIAAVRAGIHTSRLRVAMFLLTAGLAALGGILLVGQTGSALTSLGTGLELQIYAPVLLGGYSITRGGVGSPVGAFIGLAALTLLTNVLNDKGISSYWQTVVTGLVVVLAVYGDGLRGGERFD